MTLESGGIQISRIASSSVEMIAQVLPVSSWTRIAGMPVTLSALINGKLGSVSFTFPTNMDALFDSPEIVVDNLFVDIYGTPNLNTCGVRFYSYEDVAWTIQAVKLELGNHQTLAYQDEDGAWQLFETPDYGEELAKCQRYFFRSTANHCFSGCMYDASNGLFLVPYSVEMRTAPAVTAKNSGALRFYDNTAVALTAGNISVQSADGSGIKLFVSGVSGGKAGSATVTDMQFDFSAEL